MTAPAPINAAAQQFSGVAQADSILTRPWWTRDFVAAARGRPALEAASGALTMSQFGEWLLVLAGFALTGVALRNRKNERLDDRSPSYSRIPLDI